MGALIERGAAAQVEADYRAALEQIGQARVQPGTVLYWLRRCDLSAGTQREEKEYAALHAFADYIPLSAAYTARAHAYGDSGLPATVSPAIAAAVRFIRTHFAEQLTLAPDRRTGRADPELFFFPLQAGSRRRFFGLSDRLPPAIRMPPPDHRHRHDQGDCGRCGLSRLPAFLPHLQKAHGRQPAEYRRSEIRTTLTGWRQHQRMCGEP